MKRIIKALYPILALLLAAMLALTACGKKSEPEASATEEPTEIITEAPTEEPTEEPTPEPTEAPTPEPTEAGFIPEPVEDYSIFDKPLTDLCELAMEPSFDNFKKVLPGEFFDNLSQMLEAALASEGLTLASIGYESFDDFLKASLLETGMFTGSLIQTEGIENPERIDYEVLSAETADIEYVKDALSLTFGAYLDLDKVTEAYKISADMTVYGDGTSETENSEMYVYGYDGEYYILMG